MLDCGKTQIRKALKDKESLLSSYESNASNALVRVSVLLSMQISIKPSLSGYCLACSKKSILPVLN